MNYSADTCPCVLVFYTPYVLMTHLPELTVQIIYYYTILLLYYCIIVLLIQEDGLLGHKVCRKPTHADTRYLHSFHHPSTKNSVNVYPKKFIDNRNL